jgi:hypothetical protein
MPAVAEMRAILEGGLPETPCRGEEYALDRLCAGFGLTPFERLILVHCAAVEPDSSIIAMPTFSLALGSFPDAHWSALTPDGPLRRWRLIEVTPGQTLTSAPLRIDERVLHYLTGAGALDERLTSILRPLRPGAMAP